MKKSYLKLILPSLVIMLLLAGCELPRTDDTGDVPSLTTPAAVASPPGATEAPVTPTALPPAAPQVSPSVPAVAGGELPEVGPPAAIAPPVDAVEPGTVVLKLTQEASIQARSVEIGPDGVVASDIPSLDQRLREIGASDLQPVMADVAEALPNQDLNRLSVQAVEVSQLYTVSFSPDQDPQEVADKLAQDPTVEYAEPNYLAGITAGPVYRPAPFTPNDPLYSFQWHLQAIQMPTAWDSSAGQGVVVALIDTGIDFNAPDLAGTTRLPGYDFVNNDNDPTDDQSHGSHVAGTIAQTTNNGVGVAGVAYSATLLPVKVLGSDGQGSYDNIIKGIVYAVDQGAKVINMSLAGRNGSQALQEAVQYAYDHGVVVVAAAGNSGSSVEYPAAYDDYVIAVGAVRFDKTRASYSNFGPQVDLMAPGGDLDVDQNGDKYADGVLQQTFKTSGTYTYLFLEGTSMASPHVAGLAALLLSRQPGASPAEIEGLMTQTAQSLGSSDQMGAGLIQAADALAAITGPTEATFTPTPVPIAQVTETPTPTTPAPLPVTDTPTPSATPLPVCTPPACQAGEVYHCPGECPGGCGTQCATPTPGLITVTLTPIVSPTATPAPLPAGELLPNGGFETDEGWVFGDTPIRGGYDNSVKLGGNRSVRLGTVSGPDIFSYSSTWQQVALPAEANQITLRANIYPVSQDQPGCDVQQIMILNERFRVIRTLSSGLSNSQSWQPVSYDLSDLRGQTIYVYFSVVNLGRTGRPSAMYVDDVSVTLN